MYHSIQYHANLYDHPFIRVISLDPVDPEIKHTQVFLLICTCFSSKKKFSAFTCICFVMLNLNIHYGCNVAVVVTYDLEWQKQRTNCHRP